MSKLIAASIDLSKIDKSKIKRTDKNGNPYKNGQQFYDITIELKDDFDQFNNNVAITDAQTPEQRKAKEKRVFIGNGRVVWSSDNDAQKPAKTEDKQASVFNPNDDLPF